MDLLTHIYDHYARISPSGMAANNERLGASYNAEEPLESLTKRLDECADFAMAAREPVSETRIARIAYGLVTETGQYPEECGVWRNQYEISWTTFQSHFIGAQA